MSNPKGELAAKLLKVVQADRMKAYEQRNILVIEALALALRADMEAGIRLDPQEPEWPVVYIELPNGQITYHLPQHPTPWDQHTTDQKELRILTFMASMVNV